MPPRGFSRPISSLHKRVREPSSWRYAYSCCFVLYCIYPCRRLSNKIFFYTDVRRPHLGRFYIERIQKVRLHTDRAFHSLVSLQRLATWGLGPNPSTEALAHELTVRRCKLSWSFPLFLLTLFFFFFLKSFVLEIATMKENKGKEVVKEAIGQESPPQSNL